MEGVILISIAGLIAAALVAPFLTGILGRLTGVVLGIAVAALFASLCLAIPSVSQGAVHLVQMPWVPSLGVSLDFRLDGLSLLFALLISGIGSLIVFYATGYLGKDRHFGRFLAIILLFAASMMGMVLADHLILLFIFWELTSITSYLLIGFKHEDATSRRNALQALLVTGLGGVALLAGLILLGIAGGSFRITELLEKGDVIVAHPFYPAILILVLLGAFTKSAQFPFHFWLPNAMAAPTPVSAYLHSATMVKAGVYLLLRFTPIMGETGGWNNTLVIVGSVTMLYSALCGLLQKDIKRILAYTTLSVLGVLVMLTGIGTEMAIKSAIVFLLGHALYKAALFMAAGSIDHEAGTRDVTLLGGLRRFMPITAGAALLAALSKSGFPPFFGFIAKELTYKSGLSGVAGEVITWTIIGTAVATNMLLLALAFKVGVHPFFAKPKADGIIHRNNHIHEAPWTMWLGPALLALTGLVLGLLPVAMAKPLIAPASSAAFGEAIEVKLALWYGFNAALLLSVITIVGGIIIYLSRWILWRNVEDDTDPHGIDELWDKLMAGLMALASWQTRILQNGKLRIYLIVTLGTAAGLILWSMVTGWDAYEFPVSQPIDPVTMTVTVLMIIAVIGAIVARKRPTALLFLGFIGFGIALLFARLSAPDLAITQILVETLIVVLFMFVIYRLPRFTIYSSAGARAFDAVFASVFGLIMAVLALKAKGLQIGEPISGQHGDWSYLLAKGKNVVNVILVDFRALDTFGEIIVIAVAALGVFALIMRGLNRGQGQEHEAADQDIHGEGQAAAPNSTGTH